VSKHVGPGVKTWGRGSGGVSELGCSNRNTATYSSSVRILIPGSGVLVQANLKLTFYPKLVVFFKPIVLRFKLNVRTRRGGGEVGGGGTQPLNTIDFKLLYPHYAPL
jgi:hypothetical protein